jgi:hypothetical protein
MAAIVVMAVLLQDCLTAFKQPLRLVTHVAIFAASPMQKS